MIKARFYVAEVAKQAGGAHGRVSLNAVTRKTDDNVDWAVYTPSGTLVMTVNSTALAAFDALLDKDVSLTIEEIPADE